MWEQEIEHVEKLTQYLFWDETSSKYFLDTLGYMLDTSQPCQFWNIVLI